MGDVDGASRGRTRAWIVYERDRARINGAFIDLLIRGLEARGIDAELKLAEDLAAPFGRDERDPARAGTAVPPLAVMRCAVPGLHRRLERAGAICLNGSRVNGIANDKARSYGLAAEAGEALLPYRDLGIVTDGLVQAVREGLALLPGARRIVIKPVDGHGGAGVRLARDGREAADALAGLVGRRALAQRAASRLGTDVRVYVNDGAVLAAMRRQSNSDFRSNYCLGGEAEPFDPPEGARARAEFLASRLGPGFYGIDFLFDDGFPDGMVFNEFEDPVGCRMLYARTRIDPAGLIARSAVRALRADAKARMRLGMQLEDRG